MRISEILTEDPHRIGPETTLAAAANKMKWFDVGMLPICEGDQIVGTVTDRDITIRTVVSGCDPNTTPVREAMTQEIVCCFEDDINDAARLMVERQIRRLPVLNRKKRIVGIV